MESSNFEIRIFANIGGFDEIKFGNTDTLSARVVSKGILDSERGTFPVGTFAVFYDERVYALVSLVGAPTEAGFRDDKAYISVAVRKGYRLKAAKQVLNMLYEEFYKLASSYKDNVANALFNKRTELYQIVSENLERDEDQPLYPIASGRAVASYQYEEELNDLLDNPIRRELENLRALYILSLEEAHAKWSELKEKGFVAINNLTYPYTRTYQLRYPDGTEETINGLDQKVNRTCVKSYCAPLTFEGRLIDHVEDWKISLNAEKTMYTIGRTFEPEQKTYVIVATDKQGNLYPGLTYTATIGTVVNDTLILMGEDMAKRPNLTLHNRPDLKIVAQEIIEKEPLWIKLEITTVNLYDVSTLWDIVESTVGYKQDISISLVDRRTNKEVVKFSKNKKKLSVYRDLPYNQAFYKVGRTKKYEECMVFLNPDGTAGAYNPQPIEQNRVPVVVGEQDEESQKLKVTFKIEDVRLCQKLTAGKKTVFLVWKKNGEIGKVEPITQSPYTIELPPVYYVFTLQTKGYKKCVIKKDYLNGDAPQGGNEDVIPVTFEKPFYKKYACLEAVFLVILLVGFSLGFLVGEKQVKKVSMSDNVENIAEYKELKENYEQLKKEKNELVEENKRLEKQLLIDDDSDGGDSSGDSERKALKTKLEGIKFTQNDINKLEDWNPNEEEKKLIKSCQACFRLLSAPLQEKKYVKGQVEKMDGWYYTALYEQITCTEHKKAMKEIIINYNPAYTTVNKQDFRSIKDALDMYKKEMGGD